ncbi:MAG: hypothetical protein U9M89_02765 [Patescibacteria group bacterium]|nr:hypothetical protein [Patescibacteria group bacterium]
MRRKAIQIPGTIKAEDITVIIDTREQRELSLPKFHVEHDGLPTGDYSVRGLEDYICIERKSLQDYVSCVGRDRIRFERELRRMMGYPVRAVVIEASWRDLMEGNWRGKITPASAVGSYLGWCAMGIPIILAGNRRGATRAVTGLIMSGVRGMHKKLEGFAIASELVTKRK